MQTEGDADMSRLMRYEFFLRGMMSGSGGSSLTDKQKQSLANFRVCEDVTDEEHQQVLQKFGVQSIDDLSLQSPQKESKQNKPAEDEDLNLCKICFDKEIDCVLLNCGHFVVCRGCGQQLRHCPFCRKKIKKLQPIYRG